MTSSQSEAVQRNQRAIDLLEQWLNETPTPEEIEEQRKTLAEIMVYIMEREGAYPAEAPLSERPANDLLRTLKLRCGYIINGYGDAKMEAVEMERLINEHVAAAPSPTGNNDGGGNG